MEEPSGIRRKSSRNLFGDILRVGVKICCISSTLYYGGLCTEKYISNPATVTSEMVPITELPPLQWSICKQVYFSDCTEPELFFSNYFNYYDYDNECKYEKNTFGLYSNSSEAYWTEMRGYKLPDLVHFIDIWNETSASWNRIFEYGTEINSHLFRSQMILQDEQTGFWCHTLLVENPYKIRFEYKARRENLAYVAFHFDEDVQTTMKNMMKLELVQYVSQVRVKVTALQLTPDYGRQCRDQNHECSDIIEKDNTNCSLPFDIGNDKPICNEYGQGLEAIKSKLNQIKNHLRYCLQLKIIYNQEQTNFLITSVRPQYVNMFLKDSEDDRSYIFELPKFAKLISYKNEYSLPTALAYIGSVAGIFLGISVISLSTLVLNYKNWKIEIMKWNLIITKIGMSIYLLTIFILLVKKFLEYPRGTSVNFAETTSDFSMTICSSLQIYGVVVEYINYTSSEGKPYHTSNTFVSHDMFLMTNKSLWQKWSDPRNIIDSLKANVVIRHPYGQAEYRVASL